MVKDDTTVQSYTETIEHTIGSLFVLMGDTTRNASSLNDVTEKEEGTLSSPPVVRSPFEVAIPLPFFFDDDDEEED